MARSISPPCFLLFSLKPRPNPGLKRCNKLAFSLRKRAASFLGNYRFFVCGRAWEVSPPPLVSTRPASNHTLVPQPPAGPLPPVCPLHHALVPPPPAGPLPPVCPLQVTDSRFRLQVQTPGSDSRFRLQDPVLNADAGSCHPPECSGVFTNYVTQANLGV